jgi:hypothetical protein
MIVRNARLAVGVVILSSIGVFVSSTVLAQHGAVQHGADSTQSQQVQTTTLTGAWTLNKHLSDDPGQVMTAMHGERRSGSGHGPWRHGGRGHGGTDSAQMQATHARMHRAIAPARLTVTQSTGSITFTDGDGRSQTLTTNNKKQKVPLDDRTVEVRTKWVDGRLVKETSAWDGVKLTETYSLASEPRQLHVMMKLESPHLPRSVNLRRVYDAESQR